MKSSRFFGNIILVCLYVFSGAQSVAYSVTDECHWSIMGPTAITFDWRGSDNTIYYGTTNGNLTNSKVASPAIPEPDSLGSYWECALRGLLVDTLYYYRIGTSGTEHTFRTPPKQGSSGFTVVVVSDIQELPSSFPTRTRNCMNQIAAIQPAFVLLPGDLTGADDYGGATRCHNVFNEIMVWSQDAAYMPGWGNHDWEITDHNMVWIKGRCAFPNSHSAGSPPVGGGEDWSWFDYGNTRFIFVPDLWPGSPYDVWQTDAEVVFLAAQKDPNIKWIVVLVHRPAYSTGHHDNDGTKLSAPATNYFADRYSKFVLLIYGHNHICERSIPSQTHGVLHVCSGSPSQTQGSDGLPPASFTAFRARRMGFLKMTFNADAIQGWYIAADHESTGTEEAGDKNPGDIVDSWTIGTRLDVGKIAAMPNTMTLAVSQSTR